MMGSWNRGGGGGAAAAAGNSGLLFGQRAMSAEEAEQRWTFLRTAILRILNHEAGVLSYEELYRYAYMLVINKRGRLVYDGTRQCVEQHLQQVAAALLQHQQQDVFLLSLLQAWRSHRINMGMIKDVLLYLDRHFVEMHHLTPSFTTGMQLFYSTVLQQQDLQQRLRHLLLHTIQREREGEVVDRQLLREAISMLSQLRMHVHRGVYTAEFEVPFLQATREFYQQEAAQCLLTHSTPEYLIQAERRLWEECERVETYMEEETAAPLRMLLLDTWIGERFSSLLYNEKEDCRKLLLHEKYEDLLRMHRLFAALPKALEEMRKVLRETIVVQGDAIAQDEEYRKDPVAMVQQFLSLRDKYMTIVSRSFGDSREAYAALKSAFETVLNRDTRAAKYLSLYVDELFRKHLQQLREEEVQQRLDQVLILFRYLLDKDIFEAVYKQHLARRLLGTQRARVDEEERRMIARLKAECGQQYTSKMEGMYRDMQTSEELMKQFHDVQDDLLQHLPTEMRRGVVTESALEKRLRLLQTRQQRLGTSSLASAAAAVAASSLSAVQQQQSLDSSDTRLRWHSSSSSSTRDCSSAAASAAATSTILPFPPSTSAASSPAAAVPAAAAAAPPAAAAAACVPVITVRVLTQGTWPSTELPPPPCCSSSRNKLQSSSSSSSASSSSRVASSSGGRDASEEEEEAAGTAAGAELQLLPKELLLQAANFQRFYLARHSGRILRWNLVQGKGEVRGVFLSSRHDIECTTLQMILLMAFNFFTPPLCCSKRKRKAANQASSNSNSSNSSSSSGNSNSSSSSGNSNSSSSSGNSNSNSSNSNRSNSNSNSSNSNSNSSNSSNSNSSSNSSNSNSSNSNSSNSSGEGEGRGERESEWWGGGVSAGDLFSSFFEVEGAAEIAGITVQELRRHLLSLTTPRCKLLLRRSGVDGEPLSRDLKDSDHLSVNLNFSVRTTRVRAPLLAVAAASSFSISSDSSKAGGGGGGAAAGTADAAADTAAADLYAGADVPSSVEQDRNYLVEAAIVRVMKSQRKMNYNALVSAVTQQLSFRFHPSPAVIKQRVEKLVEREFLARDAADRKQYNYVA